jgi:hypothetical protein
MPRTPSAATRWRPIVDEFHRSGLKPAEFCRRRGLSLHTFRKYLYGSPVPAAESTPARFLPVGPAADPPVISRAEAAPDALVLILDDRRRLAVAPGFDPATLRRLLEVLEVHA